MMRTDEPRHACEDCTYEFVDSQKIDLWQGIVDTEDLGEVIDDLVCTLQSKLALVLETLCGVDSDGQVLSVVLSPGKVLDIFKVTKGPGEEVRAHDWSLVKADDLCAGLVALLDFLLLHVGQCSLVLWDLDFKIESGLEVRLVETGECPAGIGGLELGGKHVVVCIVSWYGSCGGYSGLVLGAVETCHLCLVSV